MDGAATGTLDVITPQGTQRYQWNGDAKDRKAAKDAFNSLMSTGYYLAVIHDKPGKGRQARSFDDLEKVEREVGTVEAQISTALVGG